MAWRKPFSNQGGYSRELPPEDVLDAKIGTLFVAGTSGMQRHEDVASYTASGSVTGTLKITLPVSWTSTMMRLRVIGYNHVSPQAWELMLSGFNFFSSSAWTVSGAQLFGRAPFSQVRFGHDGTSCCILIGATTTAWSNPKAVVQEFLGAAAGMSSDWANGWSITLITDETGITVSQTVSGLTGATTDFWRGDNTWQDLATAVRAVSLLGFSATNSNIVASDTVLAAFGKAQGQIDTLSTAVGGKEPTVTGGTAAQYWNGLKAWTDFATSVRAAALSGLSTATATAIIATDSVLVGMGKAQAQINAINTAMGGKANAGNNSDITDLNALATATWSAGGRLRGDFSSANPTAFVGSAANSPSYVPVIPNGTSNDAAWSLYTNSNRTGPWAAFFTTATTMGIGANSTTSTYLPFTLSTGGGERMRLDTAGGIFFGCTTDPIGAAISGGAMSSGSLRAFRANGSGGSPAYVGRADAGYLVQFVKNSTTQIGAITTDGTNTAYGTTSDRRLKTDINLADPDKAWERLDKYKIRSLRFKSAPDKLVEFTGVADELALANPDMVFGEQDAVAEYGVLYAMRPVGDFYDAEGRLLASEVEEPNDHSGYWNFTGFVEVVQDADYLLQMDPLPGTRWVKTREQIIPQIVDWQRPVPELILNLQTAKTKIIALEERAAAQDARIEDLTEQLLQLLDRLSA
ncbi:tail fiber domain-containing protein [Pseudomonas sp. PDM18]|uniref:tail fiber domain-containing protein n=1 Tax=Pseudomonas sp. PDM18 TaxID=2769253 RepID=UPI0017849A6E|nr:tail fiber domain-containing protein [Pseudomonas sp. PDM18]MBD9675514.1 tail fiber domain-containing protein [Pseudomonas sp. PDM18]